MSSKTISIDINSPVNRRLRALKQYKDMTDDEFQEVLIERFGSIENQEDLFEKEIENKMKEFSDDYDLTDMKINDRMSLRSLVQLTLTLENYEQRLFEYRQESEGFENIENVKKLTDVMKTLRADISSIQTDLNITRKVRKSDKDVSVIAFLDNLKKKARENYKSKMNYVFCPKCDMLLGTIWSHYSEKSRYEFICQRELDNGKQCGNKVSVNVEELLSNGGSNKPEIFPESMR